MSREHAFGYFGHVLIDGEYQHFGSRDTQQEVEIATDTGVNDLGRRQSIAAGQAVNIWAYADGANIGKLVFEIIGPTDATLYLDAQADRPVSTTDTSASGLAVTWNHLGILKYGAPFIINNYQWLTNATAANHVASGSIAASGTEIGRLYVVKAKNPGAEVVHIRRHLMN